jgi:hypothetical protein
MPACRSNRRELSSTGQRWFAIVEMKIAAIEIADLRKLLPISDLDGAGVAPFN